MQPQRMICLVFIASCLAGGPALAADRDTASHWLSRIRLVPGENERNHQSVKSAFREVVRDARKSTVRVLSGGTQVALGTVVRSDGYVATKASEIDGALQCQLADGRRLDAKIVGIHPEYDLALLKIPAKRLATVEWSDQPAPRVGSFVATTSLSEMPTAIGIASSAARPLPKPRAILGVGLERVDQRTHVNRVFPGSAAAKAGVQVGDVIDRLNGQRMQRPQEISGAIRQLLPGDRIDLVILRGDESLSIPATLGDASRLGNEEQANLMDSLGGPLSARRSGFPYVLQHDTILRPQECGGPLVDLSGKVVGINIARASRVASYAVPARQLKPVLADLIAGKYPPAAKPTALETASTGE